CADTLGGGRRGDLTLPFVNSLDENGLPTETLVAGELRELPGPSAFDTPNDSAGCVLRLRVDMSVALCAARTASRRAEVEVAGCAGDVRVVASAVDTGQERYDGTWEQAQDSVASGAGNRHHAECVRDHRRHTVRGRSRVRAFQQRAHACTQVRSARLELHSG